MAIKTLSAGFIIVAAQVVAATPLYVQPGDSGSIKMDIDLEVDGQTRRFQFDTGGSSTMLNPDEQALLYISEGKTKMMGASGMKFECDLVRPAKIAIGTFELKDFQVRRCDLGANSFNNMGIDLLDQQVFGLDFKTNELTIDASIGTSTYALQRLQNGHLKMPVKVQALELNAIFDTGAQLTAVDTAFVQANPTLFTAVRGENVTNISGRKVQAQFYEMAELDVGDLHLERVRVLAFDFSGFTSYFGQNTPVILGANAIVQANWVFDLRKNIWSVSPLP